MLSLLAVWIALATFALSVVMLAYRPAFTDVTVVLVLYFGSPGALCLAGLTYWSLRGESASTSGVPQRRQQVFVAAALAIFAAAAVYYLVIQSEKLEPVVLETSSVYHTPRNDIVAPPPVDGA